MSKSYWTYILANDRRVIYVGVTNHLARRVFEHKNKVNPNSFTSRYDVYRLVYFEETNDILEAIRREKQLKSYPRKWKVELIEKENPHWEDLSQNWFMV